jgi:dolichyl-phosphate beta-glucosyltransferase
MMSSTILVLRVAGLLRVVTWTITLGWAFFTLLLNSARFLKLSMQWLIFHGQLYAALVFWSPPPIITRDSEKKYKCFKSPNKPLPLTSLKEPSTVDLSVVVPAFNETERLPVMMAATIEHLTSLHKRKSKGDNGNQRKVNGKAINPARTFEILIVDDGSTDRTSKKALELAAQYKDCDIKVVTLEKNTGKGGAVRHGMLHASGERLLMVDADGASRFQDLELLWDAMDKIGPQSAPAVVVGSRAHLVKSEAVVKVRF